MLKIKKLVDWLRGCDGVEDVKPCKVYIYGTEYPAAWYCRLNQPLFGAQNQAPWYSYSIYCIGNKPRNHKPGNINRLVNSTRYFADGAPLYIAGYIDDHQILESYREFHPFGGNFLLMLDASYEADRGIFSTPSFTDIKIEWL